ncbi:Acyl-CoA oxidase domain protein OS=Tsukamurella paurometabola (strain ATCC 8368 / DSM / CCUG 35730 / CIP 100753 / JCM 10117 / KCTC 9821 / NBRC 16120 / NCIMB 702349 / NCTC 13040) OX=521096 GN=Tpau_0678 PE=3 SV=1 [Tsukamurella paurometabola]|uniref:acyl-CoA oxidase n=1 Tax=Tsukamurella paurometabola (strain ATCC 8368 / DSM 20162 / CCUG 35730 / CIP 100753 / JCM 10117 / KCTC 9821 / NBRC 16120 / NCIMB 702349 / NCTC 13040) TaxID=521096 RepID=D5UT28_TSUPD|nr:acyl-CoA dehydrogenase [Tsukamurella paurometabola]ADG77315.1 acyl-CoA oxidase domain protein [Tsukamurella paurometabola DSM 20162]SUP43468.1 Acyl-CoA oxidase [Tsukamurella paurometabola]
MSSPASSPELTAALRTILDGRWADTRDVVRGQIQDQGVVPRAGLSLDDYRELVLGQMKQMVPLGFPADGFRTEHGGTGDVGAAVTAIETLGYGDLSLMVKAGVQWGLFGGAVENLGTRYHHDTYVRGLIDLDVLGCFAMTETGHGSNVQELETTATYLPETGEFEIHSPTSSARKDYIGGAGKHARYAAVFAQLITGGPGEEPTGRGVHCFVVPIRDANGDDLPGVTTSDCGYKGGLPGVDNGRIVFDRVRIPRVDLLNRYADVADDGTYSSPIESDNRRFFTMLGTLIRGRVTVGAAAGAAGRLGIALATKYALVRRQFDAPGGDNELLLLDYRTHQRRLLPLVARAYAFALAQNELTAELHELQTADPDSIDPDYSREIEGKAAAIKAGHTRLASDAISAAREACGGAGYLSENRLPLLRGDIDVFTTFEGDNLVLTQLVAKEQLTAYAADVQGLDAVGWVRFVAEMARDVVLEKTAARQVVQTLLDDSNEDTEESDLTHPGTQLRLLRNRENHLLRTAADRMRRAKDPDEDPLEVFTETQDHLIKVGEAHIERIVLESFVDVITDVTDRETRDALKLMRNLYVYSLLERDLGWYLMHRQVSVERAKAIRRGVNELCGKARPIAESLVDAFGIPATALDVPMLDPANSVAVH